jgi:hypothetical protein
MGLILTCPGLGGTKRNNVAFFDNYSKFPAAKKI